MPLQPNHDEGVGPDVNASDLQPFANDTTTSATTTFTGAEISCDRNRAEASPAPNAGVNRLPRLGDRPIQIGAGLRRWPGSPDNGPTGLGARPSLVLPLPE